MMPFLKGAKTNRDNIQIRPWERFWGSFAWREYIYYVVTVCHGFLLSVRSKNMISCLCSCYKRSLWGRLWLKSSSRPHAEASLDKFINPRQVATVSRAQRLARYPAATCVWVRVYESVNEQQIVKPFRWKLHTNAAISHLFCNEHVLLLF